MRKIWLLLLILFFYSPKAYAQGPNATFSRIIGVQFATTPTGGCSTGQVAIDSANGVISPCIAGAWVTPAGGGGFTAAGDLSGNGTSQTVIGINNTLLSGLATGIPLLTAGVPSIISPTNCTTNWGQGINASGNEQCTSSVTGNITVGSLATNSDGVHPSSVQLVGNTTLPSLTANTVTDLGPPSATFTAWSLQRPSAIPTTGHMLGCTVSGTNCLLTDLGAPGTGSVGGTATIGFLPKMVTNTSTITSSLVDEGITTANVLTVADTAGLAVPNGIITSGTGPAITAGTGGGEAATEGTAFTGVATSDGWYASTANSCMDVLNHTTDIGCAVGTTGTQTLSNKTLTAPNIGAATGTSLSVTGSLTSTIATGTAPLVITSTTTVPNLTLSNHPLVQFCGTTTTCSHTAETGPKIVFGSAPLVSGAPSTATVTGISPAFTATADYICTVSAPGASAATALLGVTNVSASSFTITGPASVTTVISYICVGF